MLIKCPACQKDVSTDALRCPHCGRNISAYLKAKKHNAPYEKAMSKAAAKASIISLVSVMVVLTIVAISFFFTIQVSSSREMHELALSISPETYNGHYELTAKVCSIISTVGWCASAIAGVILGVLSIKEIKKASNTIKEQKKHMLAEEHFR